MTEPMDESDWATVREEEDRARALARRRPEGPGYTGHCAFCGDEVEHPRRWCDADCRDEWERRHGR